MSDSDTAIKELKQLLTRNRQAFLVYVDLDPVPGTFNTPYSAYLNIQGILEYSLSHYTPTVVLVNDDVYKHNDQYPRRRVCFSVFIDLDPVPGAFHTQESALLTIARLLDERIAHYNPIVATAPAEIQPHNIVEGTR